MMVQGIVDTVYGMRYVTMTVKIKRTKELQWRLKIGAALLHLAAWVMNCNIEVEMVAIVPDREVE